MTEIYKNTSPYVYLNIYGDVADSLPTARVGTTELTVNGPETVGNAQRWTATLNFAKTQNVGEVAVVWDFEIDGEPVSKTDYFDVVVPLATIQEVRDALDIDEDDFTDEEILRAERRVRGIIETYCGQRFDTRRETVTLLGSGTPNLRLPKRLASLEGVYSTWGSLPPAGFATTNDGFALRRAYPRHYNIELSPVPIEAPNYLNRIWKHGVQVTVTGLFGWERVPSKVTEAALILIEGELGSDTLYRDRYLTSMTAADWRIQFNPQAFDGTGNVVADQILAAYRINSVAVI